MFKPLFVTGNIHNFSVVENLQFEPGLFPSLINLRFQNGKYGIGWYYNQISYEHRMNALVKSVKTVDQHTISHRMPLIKNDSTTPSEYSIFKRASISDCSIT